MTSVLQFHLWSTDCRCMATYLCDRSETDSKDFPLSVGIAQTSGYVIKWESVCCSFQGHAPLVLTESLNPMKFGFGYIAALTFNQMQSLQSFFKNKSCRQWGCKMINIRIQWQPHSCAFCSVSICWYEKKSQVDHTVINSVFLHNTEAELLQFRKS